MLTKEMNQLRNSFVTKAKGVSGINGAEYVIPEHMFIEGISIGCSGQMEGDTVSFQIHAPIVTDGVPTGEYIHLPSYDFGETININPERWFQFETNSRYWAELPAGLKVVIVYTRGPTNTGDVKLFPNFFLHKVR